MNDSQIQSNSYREFAPPPALRQHVVCLWQSVRENKASTTPILPDGCIDIIWSGEQPPFVVGPMTVPVIRDASEGLTSFGVRFRPGMAPALLGVLASELVDGRVLLRDLWHGDQVARWEDVTATRPDAIRSLLAAQQARGDTADLVVRDAIARIAHYPADSVSDLANRYGLSDRQLRRRFADSVGYGPKLLQRVLRLQRLLWLAGQPGAPDLSRLSHAVGYADQAHMTREVRALAAVAPGRLLKTRTPQSAVSDLFKTGAH